MKTNFLSTALLAVLMSTTAAVTANAQMSYSGGSAPKPAASQSSSSSSSQSASVGKAVGKQLIEAQKAIAAKDWAGALADVKQAQAVPNQTAYETYEINKFLAIVAIQTKDYATATTASEAAADSPVMPEEEKKDMYHNALLLAGQAQQYDKAIGYGEKLAQMNALDDVLSAALATAYYQTKDMANAKKYAQMSLDMAKAAGKQPEANATLILGNIEGKTDPDAARRAIEQIILSQNNSDDWSKIIDDAMSKKSKAIDALFLFRLRDMVGVMRSDDYQALASLASQFHDDKEVVTVLEQGISTGKITTAQAGSKLTSARSAAARDAGVLSQVASAAQRAKTGKDALSLGEDYWGYGRYSDAAAMAQLALQKGVSDPGEAKLLLGSAQAADGKYADAQTTLAGVTGDFARTRAAHLWSLYAQVKAKGTPSAAAPQPAGH